MAPKPGLGIAGVETRNGEEDALLEQLLRRPSVHAEGIVVALGVVEGHAEIEEDARAVVGSALDAHAADLMLTAVDAVVSSTSPACPGMRCARTSGHEPSAWLIALTSRREPGARPPTCRCRSGSVSTG
jgi:hypothetical protein